MNAKVAVLLVLTLCAFGLSLTTTFNWSMPRVYGITSSVTENDDQPQQPMGDPVDGGGDIPH